MAYFCPNCGDKIFVRSLGYCPQCGANFSPSLFVDDISLEQKDAFISALDEFQVKHPVLSPSFVDAPTMFSLLLTKYDNFDLLVEALNRMGLAIQLNARIRGETQNTWGDVVIVLNGSSDIGFTHENGKITLVADLVEVGRRYDIAKLVHRISQEYRKLGGSV